MQASGTNPLGYQRKARGAKSWFGGLSRTFPFLCLYDIFCANNRLCYLLFAQSFMKGDIGV